MSEDLRRPADDIAGARPSSQCDRECSSPRQSCSLSDCSPRLFLARYLSVLKKKRFGVYLYTTLCRLCHYAASASQPLKPGTLSLYLPVPVPVLIPVVVTSRPTTASRPFNPLNPSLLAPQIFLTIVRVYKLHLLTYWLINDIYTQHMTRALNIVMTEIDWIKFICYRPL